MAGRKLLLDVPSEDPDLGVPATADALAQLIQRSSPRFAVAIFGGWGSGKTTLMHAIEHRLDPGKTIVVRFSAWRYEKEDHLIVPLLDTLREALLASDAGGRHGAERAKRTASTVGRVIRSIVAGSSIRFGVPGAIDVSFDANKALADHRGADDDATVPGSFYHAGFTALQDAFAELVVRPDVPKVRIVVFVDDLDRCLPDNALQVLESMKLFFDLPGFVFVVGLDREVIERAVDVRYARAAREAGMPRTGTMTGAEYIKKIFQLPYRVTPVARTDLRRFIAKACKENALAPSQSRELLHDVGPHLEWLVGDSSVNPREIKRYINAFVMLAEIERALDHKVLLTLQTIAFRDEWSKANDALLAFDDLFADALRRRVGGDLNALTDLDPEYGKLPDDLLEYLSEKQPGHAIFSVRQLRPYLTSAEATRSTSDSRMLEAVRGAGTVRRHFVEGAAWPLSPDVTRELSHQLSSIQAAVPPQVGPRGDSILRIASELREELSQEPGAFGTRNHVDAALAERSADLLRRLLRFYRQGDMGRV
jgi:hypothetical protein